MEETNEGKRLLEFQKRRMNDSQCYCYEKCNKHSFHVYCIREPFTDALLFAPLNWTVLKLGHSCSFEWLMKNMQISLAILSF